jgi:hemerythrin
LCQQPKVEQASVEDGLTRVLAYAIEHFDAEEALMLSTQYPGYEIHRMKHNEFRDEADRLHDICKKDIDPEDLVIRLTKWLVEWFYEQILTHDKALAAFLKKQRQESPNH